MNIYANLKFQICFWLFIIGNFAYGQLNDFSLTLSTVDETCNGNGLITMYVNDVTPEATIVFTLYKYPDVDSVIAQTSNSNFNNLDSGDYLVVATQTLGNLQNTQEADATISDLTTALDFEISQDFGDDCTTADILVNVLSGNANSYEIISGPVIRPEQATNTFDDLPEGTYVVRVFDICNNALTKTYTLILDNTSLDVSPIELPVIFSNCEEISISNLIAADTNTVLGYPIIVGYTVFPPDGSASISYTNTYESGSVSDLPITQTISIFGDAIFNIEIEVQDFCGQIFLINEEIDPNPKINLSSTTTECASKLVVQVSQFVPPYNLEFIEAPAEFNESGANSEPDGSYVEPMLSFGEDEIGVPFGTYIVMVTDSCGRSTFESIELEQELSEPIVTPSNAGCEENFGSLTVSIPEKEIVAAIFTEVPVSFTEIPPIDLSEFITEDGEIRIENSLPVGDYKLELIDECGSDYTLEFSIPEFADLDLSVFTTPNCTSETGTLRIASPYGELQQVTLTGAPNTFTESLPFDYSTEISGIGIFYAGDLPEGNYQLEVVDICGNEFLVDQLVESYQSDDSIYFLERNCGSFNITIIDLDDSVFDQSYWFQKYYADSDSWGHPNTGVIYTEGNLPNSSNAIQILNEESILNIFSTGTFRLIKAFQQFNNPNQGEYCLDIFNEFDIFFDLEIIDVYNLNCQGGSGASDVFIDVNGVPPLNFSIVEPFSFDNGDDNVFYDLQPGIYELRVEDACGSIENILINTADLAPLVTINQPSDLAICIESEDDQFLFDLSQQKASIIGNQNPDNLTVTFHLNQNDADTGNNPLSENYQNVSNPQTIYARLVNNTSDICYETIPFDLIVAPFPNLGPEESFVICDGSSIALSANSGYANYLWSTGETTQAITVNDSGTYSVTVSEAYGNVFCESSKSFTVIKSSIASIESTSIVDFNGSNNSISIEVSGLGDYEYSLDGTFYQPRSQFTNLQAGEYTVFVRDKNGCGIVSETIFLLNYMKFFTPNGDGTNDFWQVRGAQSEPDLEIFIFDRFGKILNKFKGNEPGWDGTYNNRTMPVNDYWFVIKRSNGRTYRGHFTLKR